MFNRIVAAIKKLLFSKKGSSPVVSFVILAPLILVVAFGISWFGHMADAQNVVEEAARAGARWLAAHPGDIDGAKARAAEVVEGAIGGKYIAGGNIDVPNLNNKLIGKLTKIGHKYYITDRNFGSVRVKPANGSIKKTMESLLNRTVVADGTWKNVDVFKVEVATTNPPETQTVNQTVPEQSGENGGGGGSSNTQTVSQTRHPGPFAAAALARYGEGPWGTNWGAWAYPQQGSGTVPTNGALRIQATSHNTNKYSSEWTSPNGKKIYYYPWVRVPTAQYVMVTAKNNQGSPITIRVWNGSTNYEGTGTLTFFAEANTGGNYPAYLIYVKSSTPFNDVQVVFSEPYSVVCTDSSWQYTPVDGVKYNSVTLPTNVQPGKTFNVQVQVANTGHKEWYGTAVPSWWPSSYGNGTTRLSYHWYDQSGNLVVMGGLKTSFPGVVNPGTAINRTMAIQAPSQPGTYKLVIDCVQEDVAWFGPVQGVNWPTIEANILVGGKQRDVYFSPVAVPKYMITGQRYTIRVTVTNKGTTAWSQSKCRLGYYWVDKNGKKLNERGYDLPLNVQPGSSVTFDMAVAAPSKPGAYSLVISMASVTQNGLAWWCEDDQDPCPYIKADVQIPDGDLLQGVITYDGEDYWIGMTLLDSQGPDLSALAGKDAIVWGEGKGPEQKIFIASSIEEYFPNDNDWNAVVTFDPEKDVLCNDPVAGDPEAPAGDPVGQPRADGYAYCRVTYHYPVPLRGFWRMVSHAGVPLWRGEEPPSRSLIGEAFFVSGEAGDQS